MAIYSGPGLDATLGVVINFHLKFEELRPCFAFLDTVFISDIDLSVNAILPTIELDQIVAPKNMYENFLIIDLSI